MPHWYSRAASPGKTLSSSRCVSFPEPLRVLIQPCSAHSRASKVPASDLALGPGNDLGLDLGLSDQNTADKVMGQSFSVGRVHRRAPTHRAVYRTDACSIFSAGGRQRSIYAA